MVIKPMSCRQTKTHFDLRGHGIILRKESKTTPRDDDGGSDDAGVGDDGVRWLVGTEAASQPAAKREKVNARTDLKFMNC